MSGKPKAIALVGVCPHCGEPIEIVISKKQIKAIYKGFKLPILQAQIQAEKTIGAYSTVHRDLNKAT